jgi:hypothetical protein
MTSKASVIQCAENGWQEYTVDVLYEDGDMDADSHFEGKNAKAKAEKRAEVLAKLCGCSWETNY